MEGGKTAVRANPRAALGFENAACTNPHRPAGFESAAFRWQSGAGAWRGKQPRPRASCARPRARAESVPRMRPLTPCLFSDPRAKRKPEGPRSESRPHRVGLIRYRTDSVGKSAPGLGPPRSARHEASGDCRFVRTVGRDRIRRDRSPNGVAWRFPDWTAVGFRLPHEPFDPRDVSRTRS